MGYERVENNCMLFNEQNCITSPRAHEHTCSALVIYWKKTPSQNGHSTNYTNPLEYERGSALARYEMSTRKPIPATSKNLVSVETMALDEEKDSDRHLV